MGEVSNNKKERYDTWQDSRGQGNDAIAGTKMHGRRGGLTVCLAGTAPLAIIALFLKEIQALSAFFALKKVGVTDTLVTHGRAP
jgi:hypothetical protein